DNVEIAACFAPKPMILVGATGDWTSKLMTDVYPVVRATYRLLGREENVTAAIFEAPHNYNKNSREAVYDRFGRPLFGITDPEQTREKPYQIEKPEVLTCWDADHPRPPSASAPATLQATLTRLVSEQAGRFDPSAADWPSRRGELRAWLRHELGCSLPAPDDLLVEETGRVTRTGYVARRLLLGRHGAGDRVPAVLYLPPGEKAAHATLLRHP